MNANASTLHPIYNNLFIGPSAAQMTKIEKNRKAQEEYMNTIHAYRNETGKDMEEAQAVEVYKSILAKWN
jgi:hypothetical protein